jgi:hypothetical protein
MSSGQESVIQVLESFMATLSIACCLLMGWKIWMGGSGNIANKMLAVLFGFDFILAFAYVIGRAAIPYNGLCQFQVRSVF